MQRPVARAGDLGAFGSLSPSSIALFVGIAGIALVAREAGSQTEVDAAEATRVRDIDQAQRQALVAGDADALDRILAPGFVLVPPPGRRSRVG
jgi:hypothetical protein